VFYGVNEGRDAQDTVRRGYVPPKDSGGTVGRKAGASTTLARGRCRSAGRDDQGIFEWNLVTTKRTQKTLKPPLT